MALTSTIYTAVVELSDVDRGVYESLDLRLALHPSESAEYFVTRLLAYCLEYTPGIEFTTGLSNGEEPAIVIRDLTGRLTGWIEVGLPDADRLHRAAKLADRIAVYTHREPRTLLSQLDGKRIHRAAEIPIFFFDRSFIAGIAEKLTRRMRLAVSVTERHLYLDLDGESVSTIVEEHRAGERTRD